MTESAAEAPVVHFHESHLDAVVGGTKTATLRWNEQIELGPALLVFGGHPRPSSIDGEVISVESLPLASITAEQAHQPEGTDMVEYARALRENYYPSMPDDAGVDVVVFRTLP